MIRLRAGLLAFSFLMPVSGQAYADAASEALARSFIDGIDKIDGLGAKAAAVSSSGDTTTISGLEVSEDNGDVTIRAEVIDFTALKGLESGGLSAAAIMFKAMSSKSRGGVVIDVPSIDVRNFSTPGLGGAAFDPKRPLASFAGICSRIVATEFDSIAIPAVSFAQSAEGGQPAKGSYRDIRFGGMKGSVLSTFTDGGFESTTETGAAGGAIKFVASGSTAKNVNFNAVARVLDPAAFTDGKGDGQWQNALESVAFGKITVSEGTRELATVASMAIAGVEYRQPLISFTDDLDAMAASNGFEDDQRALAFFTEHLAGLTGSFKVKAMTMDGLDARPPEGGAMKLARASLAGLSADGLDGFSLEGANIDTPEFLVKLESLQVADVVWPSLGILFQIGAMANANKAGTPPSPEVLDLISSNFLGIYPRIGLASLKGFSAGAAGLPPVTLESYSATMTGDLAGGEPLVSHVDMKSLVVPGALMRLDPSAAQAMDALGYSELVFDLTGGGKFDSKSGDYDTNLALTARDAGTVRFGYNFGGFTAERIKAFMMPILAAGDGEPDPLAMLAASAGMSLKGAELRFEDASLTNRALKFAAQMQGMDEQTLKANAIAMAQIGMSQLGAPEFTKQVMAALTAYLDGPKSITLRSAPPKPVEAAQLIQLNPADPQAALTLFGVSVTAND